ncbi:DUF6114 domain-containing protein [Nocardioides sp. WS12]|uniref:DUF6114 domain-containing protein n=1 Tax=Nocardioides sp. WS12 TaxID=2486272 RepID=UPI0015F90DAF|nr:DUF6114 domain-containing protein [Nocardioides sp. WS12]
MSVVVVDMEKTVLARTAGGLRAVRLWFRAFRRSRPFWGAVWLGLGGAAVIHFSRSPLTMVVGGGWNSSAGYILGGAMVMFALVAVFAPLYRGLCGIVGVLLGLAAFIAANLGGFLIGTLLAIVGGSMIWGWGEKRTRRSRRGPRDARGAHANSSEEVLTGGDATPDQAS